jgi:hypothetical protein
MPMCYLRADGHKQVVTHIRELQRFESFTFGLRRHFTFFTLPPRIRPSLDHRHRRPSTVVATTCPCSTSPDPSTFGRQAPTAIHHGCRCPPLHGVAQPRQPPPTIPWCCPAPIVGLIVKFISLNR